MIISLILIKAKHVYNVMFELIGFSSASKNKIINHTSSVGWGFITILYFIFFLLIFNFSNVKHVYKVMFDALI